MRLQSKTLARRIFAAFLALSSATVCFPQDKKADETPPPRPEDVVIPEGLDSLAAKQYVAIKSRTAY